MNIWLLVPGCGRIIAFPVMPDKEKSTQKQNPLFQLYAIVKYLIQEKCHGTIER
jgi:hypothetical protein